MKIDWLDACAENSSLATEIIISLIPLARIISVVIFRSLWSLRSKVGDQRIREGLKLFELIYPRYSRHIAGFDWLHCGCVATTGEVYSSRKPIRTLEFSRVCVHAVLNGTL